MRPSYLFTSESVSEGHPDKVCDQISDAILDAFLANDVKLGIEDDSQTNTRLGCETLTTTNKIVIAGECRGQEPLMKKYNGTTIMNREMLTEIARGVVKDIGYDQDGFSWHGADVEVLLHGQSPDIAMGVNAKKKKGGEEEGAGDQGMMFGYACTESEIYEKGSYMPAPIFFAHKILRTLSEQRRVRQAVRPAARREEPGDGPLRRRQGRRLHQGRRLDAAQRAEPQRQEVYARHGARPHLERSRGLAAEGLDAGEGVRLPGQPDRQLRRRRSRRRLRPDRAQDHRRHLRRLCPARRRRLLRQGPDQSRSLGGLCRALSREERRRGSGLADRCTIQVAYAIGVADPMSLLVDTHGTGKVDEKKLEKILPEMFRLTPTNIRRSLKLNRPIYRRTAAYGHFGRAPEKDGGFSWEKTDLASQLKRAL